MPLELSDIVFGYGPDGDELFNGLSLRVDDGERVALVAPSGRGKSTVLGIAGLLIRPTRGRVLIDDEVRHPDEQPDLLGHTVMWIFQSTNLLTSRTVLDNVLLPAVVHGHTRSASIPRARAALTQVGLERFDARLARTLSGGEAQRVGIARALTADPRVVLADEPTANLDARNARAVADALFRASTDAALLIATHDGTVADRADRVIEL